jgi:hypothetical protein
MNNLEVNEDTKIKSLTEDIAEYVQIYLKLAAVNATQKATVVATVTLTATLLSVFCLFILLFVGLGAAIWLGESWGNMKAGYFTVAASFILFTLGFVLLRRRVIFPYVRDHIIRKVYE